MFQNKQRWSWLALRTARDQYLQHFGKIGTGDVLILAQEIEREKVEKERERERDLRGEVANAEGRDDRGASPVVGLPSTQSVGKGDDVRMSDAPEGAINGEGEGGEQQDVKEEGEAPPVDVQETNGDRPGDVNMES